MPNRVEKPIPGKIARLLARHLVPRQQEFRQPVWVDLAEWPDWQLEDVGIGRAAHDSASATGVHLRHMALARYLCASPG